METFLIITAWLVFGYLWTYVWANYILENKRWDDTGKEVGPFSLIAMTIVGPVMAAVCLLLVTAELVFTKAGPTIKRMYGVK